MTNRDANCIGVDATLTKFLLAQKPKQNCMWIEFLGERKMALHFSETQTPLLFALFSTENADSKGFLSLEVERNTFSLDMVQKNLALTDAREGAACGQELLELFSTYLGTVLKDFAKVYAAFLKLKPELKRLCVNYQTEVVRKQQYSNDYFDDDFLFEDEDDFNWNEREFKLKCDFFTEIGLKSMTKRFDELVAELTQAQNVGVTFQPTEIPRCSSSQKCSLWLSLSETHRSRLLLSVEAMIHLLFHIRTDMQLSEADIDCETRALVNLIEPNLRQMCGQIASSWISQKPTPTPLSVLALISEFGDEISASARGLATLIGRSVSLNTPESQVIKLGLTHLAKTLETLDSVVNKKIASSPSVQTFLSSRNDGRTGFHDRYQNKHAKLNEVASEFCERLGNELCHATLESPIFALLLIGALNVDETYIQDKIPQESNKHHLCRLKLGDLGWAVGVSLKMLLRPEWIMASTKDFSVLQNT